MACGPRPACVILPPVGALSSFAYRVYERRLASSLRDHPLPQHIGVVLDGNRRYAVEQGLGDPSAGHRQGARKIDELLDWCRELDIAHVTLWLLSAANLRRHAAELGPLCDIIADTVERLATDAHHVRHGVRLTAVGDTEELPDPLRLALKDAETETAGRSGIHVQVAVGYGGREEITHALRNLLADRAARGHDLDRVVTELTPDEIGAHLYTTGTPDPDLIIRTSGEIRLSGFLLWQSAHSEFHFCDAYWPAFRKTDFLRALRDYASRQRRFGR